MKTLNIEKPEVTISTRGYNIVAIDESGAVVATAKTNCNPAALQQIITRVEMNDYHIDWENSQVAQPADHWDR